MFNFYFLKILLQIMYVLFQSLDDNLTAHPSGSVLANSSSLDVQKRNLLVDILAMLNKSVSQ